MQAVSTSTSKGGNAQDHNLDGSLLRKLCLQLNVEPPKCFSPELLGILLAALTGIELQKDLPPLELIRRVLQILSEDVVRAPLDHLDENELLQGQPEAVQDLLEIMEACVYLRDNDSSTIVSILSAASSSSRASILSSEVATLTSSSESLTSSWSSLSASSSSLSSPDATGLRKSLGSSSASCSSCDSLSLELSTLASTFSEPSQDISLPCRLCQYLAQFSLESRPFIDIDVTSDSSSDISTATHNSHVENEPVQTSTKKPLSSQKSMSGPASNYSVANQAMVGNQVAGAGISVIPPPTLATEAKATGSNRPPGAAPVRPSKAFQSTSDKRRELWHMGRMAKRKFDEEKKLSPVKKRDKSPTEYKTNVIKSKPTGLRPKHMAPPESAFPQSATAIQLPGEEEDSSTGVSFRVSPHLGRVLRKQYKNHLQWMASHGTSEAALKNLERDYEELLERHAARVKQIHKGICSQARLSALNSQKGVAASVRNLRVYAKTQEQQLAHAQLEMERISRSKEIRRRQAEEKLLRETFIEAMRLQKNQLLDLHRDLAEQRCRERDRHRIYMQGMEHFYRSQLDMLQEALEREAQDGRIRNGAQIALLRDMRRELCAKLDEEMKTLREIASDDFDNAFDGVIS